MALVTHLLTEAVKLVEVSERGATVEDFRAEFLSYWPSNSDAPLIRSLLEPHGPSRSAVVYRLRGLYIVAENSRTLSSWLDHAMPLEGTKERQIDPAILIWLDQPLLPSEYPKSTSDAIKLIRDTHLGAELDQLGAEQRQRIVIVIGAPSANGPAFAAIILKPKIPDRAGPSSLFHGGNERGFRPGHTPPVLLAKKFLASTRLVKAPVERVDASWIHGRDSDPDLARLLAAKVVVVGCGSLGGPVALGLAQAGVGSLDLVDPDLLKAANVGRHPLGASELGLSKAIALAKRIRLDYPHIQRSVGHFEGWESTAAHDPDRLLTADLVISTVGEWGPEAALNAWRQDHGFRPNALFGWTEPHAVAGHVVGLVGNRGCLACGLSAWGEPLLSVASWPSGTGQRGEPACGVMYQPYGPTEIAHVAALITEAAIDMLVGRTTMPFHRIWVARKAIMERAGGVWSEGWVAMSGGTPKDARIEERSWEQHPGCPICAKRAQ